MKAKEQRRERGYRKLREKYGFNIPEPVDHYYAFHDETPTGKAPGFIVWQNTLFQLKPVMDHVLAPLLFDDERREELRTMPLTTFCDMHNIKLRW